MNNVFITKTRVTLIEIGKVAPFIVCFVVFISYTEDIFALSFHRYVQFSDGTYLNKPVSWFIGNYFKYDIVSLLVLVVLSFAVQTCVYNKLACLYLGINLAEKSYFDFELYPEYIYAICIVNIALCSFFCYKGLRILTSLRKQ